MRSTIRSFALVLATCMGMGAMAQHALRFVENKGQWPANVSHRAEWNNATIWCEQHSVTIDLFDGEALAAGHGDINAALPVQVRHHAVKLDFLSALPNASARSERPLREHYNYFIGNDTAQWAHHARAFASVVLTNVAPGCDAHFSEGRAGLKYDLVLAPDADPAAIRFTYTGADKLMLRDGALIVHTSLGRMVERIPLAYQEINGEREQIACTYTLKNGVIGVNPGAYDHKRELVIDPTLSFATYSGSFSNNFGYTATFDQAGFLYAGSTAFGTQFPVTTGAYQTTWAGGTTDIAITKYDTTGTFLVWSTYLGGSLAEMPHSLIVDNNDQLLVLGTTGSSDFPIAGGYDNSFGGGTTFTPAGLGLSYPNGCDMIVARLSADGSALLGSTYLGGSANDGLNSAPALKFNYADEVRGEVLLDTLGRVWVVSCTQSINAPVTSGAAQSIFGGGSHDGYVARFNPLLSQLQYASFIGGSDADATFSGEFDAPGHLFVCGGTTSNNLPASVGALDPTYNGGAVADAFVARFALNGSSVDALTYWGSAAYDQAYFVELDHNDDVYLFGQTNAPTGELILNAPYNIPAGGQFITKLDPQLSTLLIGSRIGNGDGTPDISPTAFLVDVCDKIYTSGWGSNAGGLGGALSTNGLPVTPGAHQTTTDNNDLYLAVFDIDMTALTYGTYYGGGLSPEHVDGGTSRFDRRGRVYQSVCAGCQNNDDFPTSPGAWSATNNSSGCNNGVLKFDFDAPLVIAAFTAPDTVCANVPIPFTNLSSGATGYNWDFGDTQGSNATSPTHSYAPGTYLVVLTATDPNSCNGQDVATRTVVVVPAAPALSVMNDTLTCDTASTFMLTASSAGTATTWQWSSAANFSNTLNATPQDSTALLSPFGSGTYYVRATNGAGCASVDSVTITAPLAGARLLAEGNTCAGDTVLIALGIAEPPLSVVWGPAEDIISGQGTTTVFVAPMDPTTYTADVTAAFGCTWSGSIVVNVSPLFGSTVSASAQPSIVLPGTTVQLQAVPTTGVTYQWAPAALVSSPTISNPTATVQQTTTFTVTVSDGVCTRTIPVKVTVYDLHCEEPDIFVPNTFTPNGDGANDLLFVRGQHIQKLEFLVFDRWGEKVFETEDQQIGWDGSYKGKPVDPAVFVYHLTAWCVDGQRYFTKGNVTVVR